MKFHTIAAINAGEAGWVGTVCSWADEELYRSELKPTAGEAFAVAEKWANDFSAKGK